jgi:3-methylcrotonyl-CoA carboxylase alpha subunit
MGISPMKLKRAGDPREFDVGVISRDGAALRIRIGQDEIAAQFAPNAGCGGTLTIDGRRYPIFGVRRKDSILVAVGPASFEFKSPEDSSRRRARGLAAPEIVAPMPGKILNVLVKDGDLVSAGQPLIVIEAMKMETTLAAESAAVIKRVLVAAGQMVDHGAMLIELSPAPSSSAPESAPRAS